MIPENNDMVEEDTSERMVQYLLVFRCIEEFEGLLQGEDILTRQGETRALLEEWLFEGPCLPYVIFLQPHDLRRWLESAMGFLLDHFYNRRTELETSFKTQDEVDWAFCMSRAIVTARLIRADLATHTIERTIGSLLIVLNTQDGASAPVSDSD